MHDITSLVLIQSDTVPTSHHHPHFTFGYFLRTEIEKVYAQHSSAMLRRIVFSPHTASPTGKK